MISAIAYPPKFLSTLSLRRATWSTPPCKRFPYNFYPRSPCGERRQLAQGSLQPHVISIHALLAESDWRMPLSYAACQLFLSTLSLRRATYDAVFSMELATDFYPRSPCGERLGARCGAACVADFYPRSPCGERHHGHCAFGHAVDISIHALLAESDFSQKGQAA